MHKQLILLFGILLIVACQNEKTTKSTSKKTNLTQAIDSFNYLPTSTTSEVVRHPYYTLSYNETYENAEWVAYSLSPKQVSKAQRKRPYFIRDPKVKTKSAHYKNYFPNGYEKGHLLPAADMRFSEDAFDDTFYTSNVSPMDHYFNGGIWNDLEKQVRYWVKHDGKLYIVTGGILQKGLERIGRERVAVPDYFYKIILNYNNPNKPRMLGFLIKHHDSLVSPKVFVVPVDSIEKLTGIDFFPALPDAIENVLEKETHPEKWRFVKFKRY